MSRAAWYKERHSHVCADCGIELASRRAKRFPDCAARRENELARARYARRVAEEAKKKAAVKKKIAGKKKTAAIPKRDRERDMDKKTFRELKTSKLRADNERARDAMRRAEAEKRRAAAAEKRRLEESMALLRAIHARYHQRKNKLLFG